MSYINRKNVKLSDKGGMVFSVNSYGAKPDYYTGTGNVTSTTTFTCTNGSPFKPSDVGKVIYIEALGSGGYMHSTTISAYTSSTVVTLANAATNGNGAIFHFGTDSTSAFNSAINAANALGGGKVTGEAGTYLVTTVVMKRGVILDGGSQEGFKLNSPILTGEVVQSFFPINASTASHIHVKNLWINCFNPDNRATCLADVCGSYTKFVNVKVTGGIFGIVLDQSELTDVDGCVIESSGAFYQGILNGEFDPTTTGWTVSSTPAGTGSIDSATYWHINTTGTNGTRYYYQTMTGSAMFKRGFTLLMNPPIIAADEGGLPDNSVMVRIDNGTYNYELKFTTSGVKLNGGTTRTTSAPGSFIRLEVAPGGATASLKIDNAIVETGTNGLSTAGTAGIFFGDLATTADSDTYWKYLEFYSCNPIPIGLWLVNGDFFWQSRTQTAYASGGTMAGSSTTLTTGSNPYIRFAPRDVGKAITVAGAGAGGSDLVTTIASFSSYGTVTLANACNATGVTDATVTFYPASGVDFTNGISINRNSFNTTAIQLAMDGGNLQSFKDNRFNGGWKQIYLASGVNINMDNSYMESAVSHTIIARGHAVQDWNQTAFSSNTVTLEKSLLHQPTYSNYAVDLQNAGSVTLSDNYFPRGSGYAVKVDRSGGVGSVTALGNTTGGATLYGTFADIEGVSPKTTRFIQSEMSTSTSGSYSAGHFINYVFPSGASSVSSYGLTSKSTWAGTSASASAKNYAQLLESITQSTTTLGANFGQKILSTNSSTGTNTINTGLRLEVGANAGGTNTSNYGLSVKTSATSSSTLTNNYGILIENPTKTSSTITTNYGIYLESQTSGTTNYSLYSAGGQNYLAGNLGIGTVTSPATLLDIASSGNSYKATFANASVSAKIWVGADASIGTTTANNFSLFANGTDRLTVASGGGIGIGQSSPTAVLHIKAGTATANTAPIKLTSGTALTTPEDGAIEYHSSHLYFTIGSTRYQLDQQSGSSGVTVGSSTITSGTNTRVLYNNSGVLGEYTISGTGSVAMTTSPAFTTPTSATNITITGNSDSPPGPQILFTDSSSSGRNWSVTNGKSTYGALEFFVSTAAGGSANSGNSALTITKEGYLGGGGITAPSIAFETAGASNSETFRLRSSSTANWRGLSMVPGTLNQIYTNYNGTGTEAPLVIGTFTNKTNQLYLNTDGKVGILNNSPSFTLDVTGSIRGTAGVNVGGVSSDPGSPSNGDLWYNTTSNVLRARINGATVSLGAGGVTRSINSISSNQTAGSTASTDYVYFVTGTTTLTMPTASSNINRYTVKNTGSNTVTVARGGSDTIEGLTSVSLTPNQSVDLISNGTASWFIV